MDVRSLLDKMESAEEAFLQTEFLAPVAPGRPVRVRIAGVVCALRVAGEPPAGWAILKPVSLDLARVVDHPTLRQVRDYLALFPAVRLLLAARGGDAPAGDSYWLAVAAQRGDTRFHLSGPVRVEMVVGAELFQQIIARFDGSNFWFQEVDRRRNPAIAAYLRESCASALPPDRLSKPSLTAEERDAYRLAYRAIIEARRGAVEARLTEALAHAGAQLNSFIEREDSYTVTFRVDGHSHRSIISKDHLAVFVAGICLNGEDRRFDLQSLVGVIRESRR